METEITVQVFNTLKETENILLSKGFKLVEKFFLIDYYFSKHSLSKLKKLSYKSLIKNSFLVREILDDNIEYQLCYKNKILNSKDEVIAESKIKTSLKNSKDACEIFKQAGLTNWCMSHNTSFVYKNNELCVSLQVIKDLGIFIEIEEEPYMKDMSTQQKWELLIKQAKSLGLNLGKDYSCKKPYMLLHK